MDLFWKVSWDMRVWSHSEEFQRHGSGLVWQLIQPPQPLLSSWRTSWKRMAYGWEWVVVWSGCSGGLGLACGFPFHHLWATGSFEVHASPIILWIFNKTPNKTWIRSSRMLEGEVAVDRSKGMKRTQTLLPSSSIAQRKWRQQESINICLGTLMLIP